MNTKFSETVYVTNGLKIEELSYGEYLETYWNDETTTPQGVANRIQTRAIILDRDGDLIAYSRDEFNLSSYFHTEPEEIDDEGNIINSEYIPEIKYGLFTWGFGNGTFRWLGDVFETEEDAYNEILEGFERDFCTKSTNVPSCFFSLDEAKCAISENYGKSYAVIERYLQIIDYIEQKKIEQRQKEAERCEELALFYSKMINKIEGESYKKTMHRLLSAIGTKIEKSVLHKAIKIIRSN